MSFADLEEYGNRCLEEDDLRHKAEAAGLDNIDGHIAIAASLGLSFTSDEVEALTLQIPKPPELVDLNSELSLTAHATKAEPQIEFLLRHLHRPQLVPETDQHTAQETAIPKRRPVRKPPFLVYNLRRVFRDTK